MADTQAIPVFRSGDTIVGPGFVWWAIPKNASRTLLGLLAPLGERLGKRRHEAACVADLTRSRFRFAFLRDPFARIASAWTSKVHQPLDTVGARKLLARHADLQSGTTLDARRAPSTRSASPPAPDSACDDQVQMPNAENDRLSSRQET